MSTLVNFYDSLLESFNRIHDTTLFYYEEIGLEGDLLIAATTRALVDVCSPDLVNDYFSFGVQQQLDLEAQAKPDEATPETSSEQVKREEVTTSPPFKAKGFVG